MLSCTAPPIIPRLCWIHSALRHGPAVALEAVSGPNRKDVPCAAFNGQHQRPNANEKCWGVCYLQAGDLQEISECEMDEKKLI